MVHHRIWHLLTLIALHFLPHHIFFAFPSSPFSCSPFLFFIVSLLVLQDNLIPAFVYLLSYKSCGKIQNVLSFDRFLICIHKLLWILNSENDMISILKGLQKVFGDGGYRSPYLSHAKRALYHLSYVPIHTCKPVLTGPHSDFDFRVERECPGSSVGRALGF